MEDTTEVVESISHPQDHHLQLGFQAPTFSPSNPDPDSPVSDHDDTQQQPLHEEFQSLDLKEKEVKGEEISVVEEENVKNELRTDDDDHHQHVVVVVDDDDAKKSESENENENDGLNYDHVAVVDDDDDDDDAKKKSEIENKDGWSDDHRGVVVDEPKKIDGWNDDGWNDYGGVGDGDYEKRKKVENGNSDGWGDHYYPVVDDGWKMGENVNKGEESLTAFTEEEEEEEEDGSRRLQYPLRPDAEDCSFYVRTGSCKFGSNCKFNHPLKKRNQGVKERVMKAREEYPENPGQIECKYYLRSGGCKFGKACRYNHSRGKTTIVPVLDLNFVGLPIRPGEKECPYYMRTGSCKYSASCRFNHPDPTSGSDPPSGYVNGSSHSLQGVSQPTASSWSSSRTLTETAPYAPIMFPPTQGISSQNSEWNGYQAPAYPPAPDRHMHPSTPYGMNNSASETNVYTHHQQQMLVEEFPERSGQPECSYFLKTGDCKYRSNCKFHHPKNRILKSAPCAVTDKGLPLRPDQNICTHYSRYGICKFGPNCRFDHPTNIGNSVSSAVSGPDQTFDRAGFGGNANGSEAVM